MNGKSLIVVFLQFLFVHVAAFCNEPHMSTMPVYQPYLTEDQITTLCSLRKISDKDHIYEVDYTADYKLDEFIAFRERDVTKLNSVIKKTILPTSTKCEPRACNDGFACSVFAVKSFENHTVLGRNYDFLDRDCPCVVVHTHPKNGYSSVGVADLGFLGERGGFDGSNIEYLLYSPYYVLDGVNEKGFSVGVLMLTGDPANANTGKPPLNGTVVCRYLLDNAATVVDAINLLKNVDIISPSKSSNFNFHWTMADVTGDKAVVEVVNNEVVVAQRVNNDGNIVCTNFYLSKNAHDDDPTCGVWRYEMLKTWLKHMPHPSNMTSMNMLQSVRYTSDKSNFPEDKPIDWLTFWSEVFDCDERSVDICFRENYRDVYKFWVDYIK